MAQQEQNARDELIQIQQDITEAEQREAELKTRLEAIGQELLRIQTRLVEAAKQVQAREARLVDISGTLNQLSTDEARMAADLQTRSADLARSLAAMQKLSRQPTAVLIARPGDATETARTALVLNQVMPALQAEADALRTDMEQLVQLRADIELQRNAEQRELEALAARQLELDDLMGARRGAQAKLQKEVTAEQERLQELGKQAKSLEDLVAKLESGGVRTGLEIIGQTRDAPAFSSLRGNLPLPVAGRIITRFGEPDPAGQALKGLRIRARDDAQVTAPFDGKVVYAGPFRDYGLLLIISHGEGYHSLLAGLDRLDAQVAQWVLAGEPVGRMGRGNTGTAQRGSHTLYLELRQNGKSINPLPWLALNSQEGTG